MKNKFSNIMFLSDGDWDKFVLRQTNKHSMSESKSDKVNEA